MTGRLRGPGGQEGKSVASVIEEEELARRDLDIGGLIWFCILREIGRGHPGS